MLQTGLRGAGLLLAFLTFRPAASANLITNGDFSSGLADFSTDYRYVAPVSQFSCYEETSFSITTSPNVCHNEWADFGDHTTGHGNMMVVNGATSPGFSLWVSGPGSGSPGLGMLQQDTDYYFSGWVASAFPADPVQIQVAVDGSQVGGRLILGDFTATSTAGVWQQFRFTWNSSSNIAAQLSITDLNIARIDGNDFALDDLTFDTVASLPAPEPSNLFLLVGALPLLLMAGSEPGARSSANQFLLDRPPLKLYVGKRANLKSDCRGRSQQAPFPLRDQGWLGDPRRAGAGAQFRPAGRTQSSRFPARLRAASDKRSAGGNSALVFTRSWLTAKNTAEAATECRLGVRPPSCPRAVRRKCHLVVQNDAHPSDGMALISSKEVPLV